MVTKYGDILLIFLSGLAIKTHKIFKIIFNNVCFIIYHRKSKMTSQSDNDTNEIEYNESCIIKLRGLPWTATKQEVAEFLDGVNIVDGEEGVHLITFSGNTQRPNGEAFIVCETQDDYKRAFDFNKKLLGHRYIEGNIYIIITQFPKKF